MEYVNPDGWQRPKGYNNGVVAEGRILAVAGQIGWNEREEFAGDNFLAQAVQALENVVTIVRAAGGTPRDIVRLTWYVVDKREYLAVAKDLGAAYRRILESHFPAMALVQVSALLEDRARVEIEATAVIP